MFYYHKRHGLDYQRVGRSRHDKNYADRTALPSSTSPSTPSTHPRKVPEAINPFKHFPRRRNVKQLDLDQKLTGATGRTTLRLKAKRLGRTKTQSILRRLMSTQIKNDGVFRQLQLALNVTGRRGHQETDDAMLLRGLHTLKLDRSLRTGLLRCRATVERAIQETPQKLAEEQEKAKLVEEYWKEDEPHLRAKTEERQRNQEQVLRQQQDKKRFQRMRKARLMLEEKFGRLYQKQFRKVKAERHHRKRVAAARREKLLQRKREEAEKAQREGEAVARLQEWRRKVQMEKEKQEQEEAMRRNRKEENERRERETAARLQEEMRQQEVTLLARFPGSGIL